MSTRPSRENQNGPIWWRLPIVNIANNIVPPQFRDQRWLAGRMLARLFRFFRFVRRRTCQKPALSSAPSTVIHFFIMIHSQHREFSQYFGTRNGFLKNTRLGMRVQSSAGPAVAAVSAVMPRPWAIREPKATAMRAGHKQLLAIASQA